MALYPCYRAIAGFVILVVTVPSAGATAMIDIHSHILPDQDDGARTFEEALSMVRMAAEAFPLILTGAAVTLPSCGPPSCYVTN